MFMFFKSSLTTILIGLASQASAVDTYNCVRTALGLSGFKSFAAAEAYFPKETVFQVDGSRVGSDYYGMGGNSEDQYGRMKFTFKLDIESSFKPTIIYTYWPTTNKFTSRMNTPHGFENIIGGSGHCKKS